MEYIKSGMLFDDDNVYLQAPVTGEYLIKGTVSKPLSIPHDDPMIIEVDGVNYEINIEKGTSFVFSVPTKTIQQSHYINIVSQYGGMMVCWSLYKF